MIRVQVYAVLASYATYWESSVLMAHWRNSLFVKWWYELTLQMEAFVNSVCWRNERGDHKVGLVKLEVKLIKNSINLIVS